MHQIYKATKIYQGQQRKHAEHGVPGHAFLPGGGQNPTSVKGVNGDHVEYRQHQIDSEGHLDEVQQGLRSLAVSGGPCAGKHQNPPENKCEDEV